MDTNTVFGMLDLIVLGAGIYILYGWFALKTKGDLKSGILLPKNVDPKQCTDLKGYSDYMGPRTLILGIIAVVDGAIGLYQDYVRPINQIVYWVSFSVFLIALIWFAVCSKKALKKYFNL